MKLNNKKFIAAGLFITTLSVLPVQSGTITIGGTGSSGAAPIFVTTALSNIDIGTRIRIGSFSDLTALNNSINDFTTGSSNYSQTLLSLNNNFVDFGTGVTNFGNSSQVAVGGAAFTPSTSQFRFNNVSSLTINGVTSSWNVFNGTITSVNYSSATGPGKNLYMWIAHNDQIGIVRNADGSGTSAWTTPGSDLSGVTMNLNGINSQSEVLLGTYVANTSGSNFIALAVPEPGSSTLLFSGIALLIASKSLRRQKVKLS